jgi:hypothetical protein
MLVFSIPLVNYSAPLTFAVRTGSPTRSLSELVQRYVFIQCVTGGGGGGGDRGLRTDKHLPPSTFTGQFKKSRQLIRVLCLIDIWACLQGLMPEARPRFLFCRLKMLRPRPLTPLFVR